MRPFGKEKASKRAWWLGLLAEGTDLAPIFVESVKLENHLARELMVTPVITAPADATVPELADLLERHHIKRLPMAVRDRQTRRDRTAKDVVRHRLDAGRDRRSNVTSSGNGYRGSPVIDCRSRHLHTPADRASRFDCPAKFVLPVPNALAPADG